MKVYVITKTRTIEYEGSDFEIVAVYGDLDAVRSEVERLRDEERDVNVEYDYSQFDVL